MPEQKNRKKEKINPKALPFLSDAGEIRYAQLPFLYRHCGLLGLLLLAIFILWASLGETDRIVQAEGQLISLQPDIVMKPVETSVLKSVQVKVGDLVKKDQVLVTFDPVVKDAEILRLRKELHLLEAKFARLYAEFKGRAYKSTGGDPGNWQEEIFGQRQKYYQEKLVFFAQEIKRIEAAEKSAAESLQKQQESLEAISRIEKMYITLKKSNAASMRDVLEMAIKRISTETQVTMLRNSISQYAHEKLSVTASRNAFIEEWRNSVSERLVECQRELTAVKKEYEKAVRKASYTIVKAPCDAVVHEIAATASIGSAVGEAEPLLTLVPLDGSILAEVEVRPSDIGRIREGHSGRIKFSAFPFQKHGTMEGKVISISRNTFQQKNQAALPGGWGEKGEEGTFYRVRLSLSGKLRQTESHFMLIPGMKIQAELKVGKRRIIEYILYPLLKGLDEAGREP